MPVYVQRVGTAGGGPEHIGVEDRGINRHAVPQRIDDRGWRKAYGVLLIGRRGPDIEEEAERLRPFVCQYVCTDGQLERLGAIHDAEHRVIRTIRKARADGVLDQGCAGSREDARFRYRTSLEVGPSLGAG